MPPNKRLPSGRTARKLYSAPALEKGMDILELLAEEEGGLTLSEIAQQLDRRMSDLFRILIVLERRGWLQKEMDSARYFIAYHMLRVAHRGTPSKSLAIAAAPSMEALSARINQSCHLVVRSRTQGLVILRQENQWRHANLSVRLGATIDLATSCSGHVLLAHLDTAERDAVLATVPRPRGMSRGALDAKLARVRKRGYDLQRSPITAGVTDIGYPVRSFDGKVVAALTVPFLHALDGSLPTTVEQARRLLEEAARRVSQSLGFVH